MKTYLKFIIYLTIFWFANSLIAQQITIDNSLSPQSLVENTIDGDCLEVSNISSQVNGNSVGFGSYGFFQRGSSSFPFESGMILSTGNASSAGNVLNSEVLKEIMIYVSYEFLLRTIKLTYPPLVLYPKYLNYFLSIL